MSLKIRNLAKKDIAECVKLALEAGASSNAKEARKIMEYSLAKGIKPLNPNYYLLTLDGKIIGISGLYYDYEDPNGIMWLDYLAVKPELQGQGYGSIMLENLEKIAKGKKVKKLCVFTDSEKPVGFYEKKGFKVCGRLEEYYGKNPRIWLFKKIA